MDIDAIAREAESEALDHLRAAVEREQAVRAVCAHLSGHDDLRGALAALASALGPLMSCSAVGIRLRNGSDFPYFVTTGFDESFVRKESSILRRSCNRGGCAGRCGDAHAGPHVTATTASAVGAAAGDVDCMCGNVVSGLYDPSVGTFTPRGTFWSNDVRALDDAQLSFGCPPRNMCAVEGYRSVALAPIRVAGEVVGLLQCNDRQPDRFTPDAIRSLETVALSVGAALAGALRSSRLPAALAQSLAHLAGAEAPPGPSSGASTARTAGNAVVDIEDVLGRADMSSYADVFRTRNITRSSQLAPMTADQLVSALGISAASAAKVSASVDAAAVGAVLVDDVRVGERIGQGEFGTVWSALWGGRRVAVKQVRSAAHLKALVHEAAVLSRLEHPHVIRLHGVARVSALPSLVMELAEGSLLDYLRSGAVGSGSPRLAEYAEAAAAGLEYLAAQGVIHRDLACRNLLYTLRDDGGLSVKISDFGLAHLVDAGDAGAAGLRGAAGRSSKVAVRWAAMETLALGACTLASDAWSFGVVMWEIWSLGAVPYDGVANADVLPLLAKGHRLQLPQGCPETVWRCMQSLWREDPQRRPRISQGAWAPLFAHLAREEILPRLSDPGDALAFASAYPVVRGPAWSFVLSAAEKTAQQRPDVPESPAAWVCRSASVPLARWLFATGRLGPCAVSDVELASELRTREMAEWFACEWAKERCSSHGSADAILAALRGATLPAAQCVHSVLVAKATPRFRGSGFEWHCLRAALENPSTAVLDWAVATWGSRGPTDAEELERGLCAAVRGAERSGSLAAVKFYEKRFGLDKTLCLRHAFFGALEKDAGGIGTPVADWFVERFGLPDAKSRFLEAINGPEPQVAMGVCELRWVLRHYLIENKEISDGAIFKFAWTADAHLIALAERFPTRIDKNLAARLVLACCRAWNSDGARRVFEMFRLRAEDVRPQRLLTSIRTFGKPNEGEALRLAAWFAEGCGFSSAELDQAAAHYYVKRGDHLAQQIAVVYSKAATRAAGPDDSCSAQERACGGGYATDIETPATPVASRRASEYTPKHKSSAYSLKHRLRYSCSVM
eukprot:m51a1_g10129 putative protein tyrosine kinase src (1076) ;mRNA; r:89290-93185